MHKIAVITIGAVFLFLLAALKIKKNYGTDVLQDRLHNRTGSSRCAVPVPRSHPCKMGFPGIRGNLRASASERIFRTETGKESGKRREQITSPFQGIFLSGMNCPDAKKHTGHREISPESGLKILHDCLFCDVTHRGIKSIFLNERHSGRILK